MAAVVNMPDIKSGKIIQLSELHTWAPDDVHGNSVRLLGRVTQLDILKETIRIEYHGSHLVIDASLLGDLGPFRVGNFAQFLGELQRQDEQFILKARLGWDATGLDSDLYDRALKVRRDFEKKVIEPRERQS